MNAPFYKYGVFDDEVSLIVAFVIGIAFGFVLERAGFGSARKLAAQFYFKDLAVFKVMFTAIVTAMIGTYLLSVFGWLDMSLIYLTPTHLVPQIVGGLLLGLGFVVGGYCPGTSVVSAGTGRIDGMFYLVGVMLGLFGFAELYPWIGEWTHSTDLGQITLAQYFGVPYGMLVLAVVLMAVAGFVGAELAEKKWGGVKPGPASLTVPPLKLTPVRGFMAILLALGLVSVFLGSPYKGSKVVVDTKELSLIVDSKVDHVMAEDIAAKIIEGDMDYLLIDLREPEEYAKYHIPTAINMPLASEEFDGLPRNEKIVLYSGGGIHSAQAWFLLKARGYPAAYMVFEGLNAWMDEVLYPEKPLGTDQVALAGFAKKVEMAKFFGGQALDGGGEGVKKPALPVSAPPVMTQPIPSGKKRKSREGC